MLSGFYSAKKKDGTVYFRSNITYQNKHISLGSYETEEEAHCAYICAKKLLFESNLAFGDPLPKNWNLPFDKTVALFNFRDNHIYIANPIYLKNRYFSYYLSANEELKFDIDDLFYYSRHKIIRRGGHLFVNDYGMQITILSRYGIHNHAVMGRDYRFANGDDTDYRYENVIVINPYYGVTRFEKNGLPCYRAKIHINGNYTIGTYRSPEKAAIAYNKAADLAKKAGILKNFPENFVESYSPREYADAYTKIKISSHYLNYLDSLQPS